MAFKYLATSLHPAFIPFGQWAESKIAEHELNGRTAEANAIKHALALKFAANSKDGVVENSDGSMTRPTETVRVPEFDAIYDLWVAEFNVQHTVEEV